MTRNACLLCAMAVAVGLGGCRPGQGQEGPRAIEVGEGQGAPSTVITKVRQPAVAGIFYPRNREMLARQVDRDLAEAKSEQVENLRAMICPHAGYDFSGPIAAVAYKQLTGRRFDTVVVAAPSHYARFQGASIPDVDAYETPLGLVPLSPWAKKVVGVGPMVSNPSCEVQRPGWWRQASKELPPFGEDTPHTWEHSLEVQLPFLQQTLERFSIVPIVIGRADAEEVAEALQTVLDEKTLLIASSDLSHHHPYDVARELDAESIKAICELDVEWFERAGRSSSEEPCGVLPVLAVMHLAKKNGWRARLLDYRNSGDTSGDKSAVVGYAAIVFFEPQEGDKLDSDAPETPAKPPSEEEGDDPENAAAEGPAKPPSEKAPAGLPDDSAGDLTPREGRLLLELASKAVAEAVAGEGQSGGGQSSDDSVDVPTSLTERRACFVTLTKEGRLRGCIGSILPAEPLFEAVRARARSAATEDPRFPPVTKEELDELSVEVSVLSIPQVLEHESPDDLLRKLRPRVDGVVLQVGRRQSTYLPQVWEQLPEPEAFLAQLSLKAGLPPAAWKDPRALILTYQVQAFEEQEE